MSLLKNSRGFTLVELLMVFIVLGALIQVGLVYFIDLRTRSSDGKSFPVRAWRLEPWATSSGSRPAPTASNAVASTGSIRNGVRSSPAQRRVKRSASTNETSPFYWRP